MLESEEEGLLGERETKDKVEGVGSGAGVVDNSTVPKGNPDLATQQD